MSDWLQHPAWPYLAGALLLRLTPRPLRAVPLLAAPALAVWVASTLPDGAQAGTTVMGQELVWLRVDALGRVFAIIFALFGGLATVYSLGVRARGLHAAAFTATAAALGVVLAGDWITLYLCWEGLAVASFVLVIDGRTRRATAAAFRYLLVHAAGGALLLAGIVWSRVAGGPVLVGPVPFGGPGALILLGFAVNAAIPPFHAWLTDAYPESSPGGAVFLSAFATKSAVYALARVFPGQELLVWAGVTMALYGIVFAVLENDIRRLLGYHIVSQVGYMVTGVGLGTPLALSGAAAHAFSHILYKGLLLMGTGAVVETTGRRKLTELGGLARRMPGVLALYMVGAFSISGAPLLNGFVSKSLVVAAAEAEHRPTVVLLLTLASVGTFLHTGLKLPYFTWGGPDRGLAPGRLPGPMLAGMILSAVLCFVTGSFPQTFYPLLPFPVTYEPYTAPHVLGTIQLLGGTAIGFVLLIRYLGGTPTVTLDTDRVYRAFGSWIAGGLAPAVAWVADRLEAGASALAGVPLDRSRVTLAGPVGYTLLIALLILGIGLTLLAPR